MKEYGFENQIWLVFDFIMRFKREYLKIYSRLEVYIKPKKNYIEIKLSVDKDWRVFLEEDRELLRTVDRAFKQKDGLTYNILSLRDSNKALKSFLKEFKKEYKDICVEQSKIIFR